MRFLSSIGRYLARHSNAIKMGMIMGLLVGNFMALRQLSNIQQDLKDRSAQGQVITEEFRNRIAGVVDKIVASQERDARLTQCLLLAHGISDSISSSDEERCRQEARKVPNVPNSISPTPQSSLNNDPEPSPSEPRNQNTKPKSNGGGEEEPPEDFDIPLLPEAIENVVGL